MCTGSKSKLFPSNLIMENQFQNQNNEGFSKFSILLELSASDDLIAFKSEIEGRGFDVDEPSFWYGRRIGSKKMGYEARTPLMIAAMFGSTKVLNYIVETGKVDVNKACGSDEVTALHCAVAGGSNSSPEAIKILLNASADANCVDANGNKPIDLISPALRALSNSKRKAMELLLNGDNSIMEDQEEQVMKKEVVEKKEYPMDVSLPDINTGMYGTDEFRMYTFKVKPCSRAYSHDWTECPFVHPGENARRRDPRKYPYSCVPCPEFRKGACPKGDGCEYAHGVFESWLHPAQYRTRLCKDETGCSRKVCFFAHKHEELRPVYACTGSAMPSPKSVAANGLEMTTMSPLALGSSALALPTTSTPPMSPLAAASSSPKSGSLWGQNKINLTLPTLQLSGSRLKTALSARDLDLEMELLRLESLSSPSYMNKEFGRIGELKPTNLDDVFGSLDPSVMSQLQGLSHKATTPTQLHSPTGLQMRQNMNQLRASYPSNLPTSTPARKPSPFGFDSSAAVAQAVMNSRSSAFAKRSQSFIDRGAVSSHPPGFPAAVANSMSSMASSNHSAWSSPDGKLDWGIQGDELNKLKKSASFGFRSNNALPSTLDEPDVSWVNSLVKDVPPAGAGMYGTEQKQYNPGKGVHEKLPPWLEQMYIEQEQMVA